MPITVPPLSAAPRAAASITPPSPPQTSTAPAAASARPTACASAAVLRLHTPPPATAICRRRRGARGGGQGGGGGGGEGGAREIAGRRGGGAGRAAEARERAAEALARGPLHMIDGRRPRQLVAHREERVREGRERHARHPVGERRPEPAHRRPVTDAVDLQLGEPPRLEADERAEQVEEDAAVGRRHGAYCRSAAAERPRPTRPASKATPFSATAVRCARRNAGSAAGASPRAWTATRRR